MKHKLPRAFLIVICSLMLIPSVSSEGLVIVVNSGNSATAISKQDCKNIFLGKKTTWSNGASIIFVEPKANSELKKGFNTEYLGMSVAEVQKYWVRETVRGNLPLPQVVGSSDEIIAYISNNRDAIGYLDKADVPSTGKVKVISAN